METLLPPPTHTNKQKQSTQQHPGMEGLVQDGFLVILTVSLLVDRSPSWHAGGQTCQAEVASTP